MNQIRRQILYFLLCLYGFHLVLKFNHIPVPLWFSNYFADLLCMPIILLIANAFIAKTQNQVQFKLSLAMILFTTAYVSIVFELFLPLFYPSRFTQDANDILCYSIGSSFFYSFNKISSN